MGQKVAYIDSSAFVKLVIAEQESQALRQALTQWPERVSVALLRTEIIRALRRSGNETYIGKARRLLESVNLIRIDNPLLDRAGDLDPSGLRSLDALHLAAVLEMSTDIDIMFVYDIRIKQAAEAYGIEVCSPT